VPAKLQDEDKSEPFGPLRAHRVHRFEQRGARGASGAEAFVETISLRLPEATIAELKMLANRRDVPYQALLKAFLSARIACERGRQSSAGWKRS
jgi:hypothetical protein